MPHSKLYLARVAVSLISICQHPRTPMACKIAPTIELIPYLVFYMTLQDDIKKGLLVSGKSHWLSALCPTSHERTIKAKLSLQKRHNIKRKFCMLAAEY